MAALQRSLATRDTGVAGPTDFLGTLTQQTVWALQKRNDLVRDAALKLNKRYALEHDRALPPVGGSGSP